MLAWCSSHMKPAKLNRNMLSPQCSQNISLNRSQKVFFLFDVHYGQSDYFSHCSVVSFLIKVVSLGLIRGHISMKKIVRICRIQFEIMVESPDPHDLSTFLAPRDLACAYFVVAQRTCSNMMSCFR